MRGLSACSHGADCHADCSADDAEMHSMDGAGLAGFRWSAQAGSETELSRQRAVHGLQHVHVESHLVGTM